MNSRLKLVNWIVAVATFVCFAALVQPVQSAGEMPPIKIGLLEPLTGPLALVGKDNLDGHSLYLEKIGGSVAGRKIELIVEDTETKGDVALTKAKKLVERDRVDVLAGLHSSASCYAVAPYVRDKKVLMIVTGNCGAEGLTKIASLRSPYLWRTTHNTSMLGSTMAEYMLKNNMKRAAFVCSGYAGGYEVADGFARPFIEGGGTIVQEIYPALGTTDFGPFMAQIKQDVDAVVTFLIGSDGLRFAQQYAEYGLKGKLPLMDLGEVIASSNVPQLKDVAVGIITSGYYSPDSDTPQNKEFLRRFEKRYKNRFLTYDIANGYAGMHIIVAALEAAGGNPQDAQKVIAALKNLRLNTTRGFFMFDEYQNVVEDWYIKRVEKTDGKYVYKTIYKIPNVSQFGKWKPEEVLNFPFGKLYGKYTNINKAQLQDLIKSASQ